MLLALLLLTIVSFLTSHYKYASFEELLRYASYVGLYFLVRKQVKTEHQIDCLIAATVISTAIVCIYGLLQRAGYDFIHWDNTSKRILSTFGHPNFFAGYLIIIIPILMVGFLVYHSWVKRTVLAVTLVMAVLCLLFTYSRGAFLGILAALVVLGLWLLFYLKPAYLRRNKHQLVALMLLLLVPLVVTVVLDTRLVERASSAVKLETKVTVSNQARLVIWRGALVMFQAKPIFGWGVGTFQIYFPRFRPSDYSRRGVSHNTQHAHSEYLEIAAELGIVGLGAFLTVIILYFLRVHRTLKTFGEIKPKLLLIGCSCGVLASLLHNLVSVSLRWTEPAVTFWFVFGLTTVLMDWTALQSSSAEITSLSLNDNQLNHLLTEDHRRSATRRLNKASQFFLLSLITLVLSAMILALFVSDIYTGFAQRYLKQGNISMTAQMARRACYWTPNPKAYYSLAAAYFQQGYVKDAVRIYHRLEGLAPDYAQIHHNLASAYAALNQTDIAIEEARKAVVSEDIPITHVMLADLLLKQGVWSQAEKELQRTLELDAHFVYAWERLGAIYSITEEYEKAIKSYQKVLKSKEDSVAARLGIAVCYENLGQWNEAQDHYRHIVEAYPKHPLAKEARKRLIQPKERNEDY